jgi:two-component sensor histidine kinase
VPEVLLVPLHLGGEAPLGTLWIVSEEEQHFDSGHARAVMELASFVGIALRMVRAEQRLWQILSEQEILAKEMSHRIKNLFAITDGMIRMSVRGASTKEELAESLAGRLHALARAHTLVRSSFRNLTDAPEGSTLADLIKTIVQPYESDAKMQPRFNLEGPVIRCSDRALNGIALVFHELATNAAKYGALINDQGYVDVSWRQDNGMVVLHWIERNGPPIKSPLASKGFGTTLVENTIARQFGGTLSHDWRTEGLMATITFPIDRFSA